MTGFMGQNRDVIGDHCALGPVRADAETLAALERAIGAMLWEVENANGDSEQVEADVARIRDLIAALRAQK